ncbi:uncharacterized protein A1O9_00152 [Exophiala aquamarina CBS 119918]|uniref:Pre-mRNA-splicing factor n=1 Tax=Exophiala aquamarina CBS 119918 TaxID=1182545 RepID=A0A072Q2Q1_9EURO|nr:uncharacterized protein A1O9_00152 [Exophiala aquamarina CBS 119918]KEF62180.1 hypothetical protein A1O9_00152 [Exophiala aquamarina CBS 119918]
MSKPISFGFGKPKSSTFAQKIPTPARRPAASHRSSKATLGHDSDQEDEKEPRHESVTGFSSSGAILSKPLQEPKERVIENVGNGDWRKRGRKNLLPSEVQAQQENGSALRVETVEVSKASGLQFAPETAEEETNGYNDQSHRDEAQSPPRKLTADEEALNALLDDGSGKLKSTAVIIQQGNTRLSSRDETEEFRDDVASRPESSTLEDYAAMPVEEFGMAMLRGMGKKRRANGEVIDLNPKAEDSRKARKQEGFLGIGAKAAPGTGVELGAWGKADMRKNNKGEGFFTPLMRENKATGERITEVELQKKIKESKGDMKEEDWRERRDRNLENSQRDRDRDRERLPTNGSSSYRDEMNSFSRTSKRDKDDRDHERSRSTRDRSRSKERRRRDDDDHDSRHRDRRKDRYRDDERYDSSSSRRSHRDYDRDSDRSGRRHRDRR